MHIQPTNVQRGNAAFVMDVQRGNATSVMAMIPSSQDWADFLPLCPLFECELVSRGQTAFFFFFIWSGKKGLVRFEYPHLFPKSRY